ncbi:spore coat protein YsxE [Bacillus sp. V3B]|uniref:spore coat protein YsxE n=1 Tax=Bacillus sp. V3B TaxID=2804915 RepID=UPI00210AB257|nr:spore coat protein YsxE [Bacillus sp. V3B]MCQ6273505.1 spore coat protein YsxE [Bacillus sp. V3B]
MRETNSLKKVKHMLKSYGIEPYFVEEMGNIQKVYSNHGVFAFKKINPHHGIDFIRYVQSLYQKGYNRIVPIYPTLDGRYAILYENALYYLMPWLSNKEKGDPIERNHRLFRELSRLHSLSVHEITVSQEARTAHYEKTVEDLEREEEFLEGYLEACERKIYMAPIELMFCSYYHDINQALKFSKKKLKEWYEATKEHEKARVVIIHGKMADDHFLYDDKGYGYFINFEQANIGSPSHDLLPFLAKSLRGFPKSPEEIVEWVYTYFKYFPLKEEEMHLFLSYLAHPGPVIKTAERFFRENEKRNERKAVQKLQKEYWLLKNTEYVVSRIDEIERLKKQEEARNEQ